MVVCLFVCFPLIWTNCCCLSGLTSGTWPSLRRKTAQADRFSLDVGAQILTRAWVCCLWHCGTRRHISDEVEAEISDGFTMQDLEAQNASLEKNPSPKFLPTFVCRNPFGSHSLYDIPFMFLRRTKVKHLGNYPRPQKRTTFQFL